MIQTHIQFKLSKQHKSINPSSSFMYLLHHSLVASKVTVTAFKFIAHVHGSDPVPLAVPIAIVRTPSERHILMPSIHPNIQYIAYWKSK